MSADVAAAGSRLRRLGAPVSEVERPVLAGRLRVALLVTAGFVGPLTESNQPVTLLLLATVMLLAVAGSRLGYRTPWKIVLLLGESLSASIGILLAPDRPASLLLCLPAAAIGAGLAAGYKGSLLTSGVAAAFLPLAWLQADGGGPPSEPLGITARWILVMLVSGLLAAGLRAVSSSRAHQQDGYAEAHRLLAELRAVTRGLPGSLDPGSAARTLLEDCTRLSGCEHGSVLLDAGGDQLVPLALHGYQRVPWRASLSGEGPLQRAWMYGSPVLDQRPPDVSGARAGSALLVLPMTVESHRVGVVVLESRRLDAFDPDLRASLMDTVDRHALPLATAALFDELRIAAAAEERTRLAREMHDGVAQDLAFIGYEVDALVAALRDEPRSRQAEQAATIRAHVTGLISDLRLSICDLRSSTGPERGLGAALSEYVRTAGTSSRITVHLSLSEGSTRLPAETEVQLLRISHEVVSRARRRVDVHNLWLVLRVDPPSAMLLVEDDGPVTEDFPSHSWSQEMTERAARIGGTFHVERRLPTGTRVRVALGEGARVDHDPAHR